MTLWDVIAGLLVIFVGLEFTRFMLRRRHERYNPRLDAVASLGAAAVAAFAINASQPMGMGNLSYEPREYTAAEVADALTMLWPNALHGPHIQVDYFEGRMVKFYARRLEPGGDTYEIHTLMGPEASYQSWVKTYPTYTDLIKAVEGVEILEPEDSGRNRVRQ